MKSINRRKTSHAPNGQQQAHAPSSQAGAFVEVGNFGLEEEVDRLKRDKNVLMQELVRLRQQQQATDHQLQNVGQRVQVMEQRQQQMMSFLGKAMQRPGYLAQFVQQQNESNRHIAGGNKKRRLPRQEEENLPGGQLINPPDGQMIKFHSSMNEAAKAMLRQILKMNPSPRREGSMNNPDAFLIGNVPSSNAFDTGRFSEVTLPEVPQTTAKPFAEAKSGFPVSRPPKAVSEINPSPPVVNNYVKAPQFPEAKLHGSLEEKIMPNVILMQGTQPQNSEELLDGTNNAECMDMAAVLDGAMHIDTEAFPYDPHDGDILLEGTPKLPGINDSFWEQFFTGGETDENHSSSVDGGAADDHDENGWEHSQHMSDLTEGMGFLTSDFGMV